MNVDLPKINASRFQCFSYDPEVDEDPVPPSENATAVPTFLATHGDTIVQTSTRPSVAFQSFAGRVYDDRGVAIAEKELSSFVEQLGKPRDMQRGFVSRSSTTGSQDPASETPLARFERLRNEMSSFTDDLRVFRRQKDTPNEPSGSHSQQMAQEDVVLALSAELEKGVSRMSEQLTRMGRDASYQYLLQGTAPSSEGKAEIEDSSGMSRLDVVLSQLKVLQDGDVAVSTEQSGEDGSEDKESTTDGANEASTGAEVVRNRQLVRLEQRLSQLEQFVGSPLTQSGTGFPYANLHAAVTHVAQRMRLLDPQRLQHVRGLVNKTLVDMQRLKEERESGSGGQGNGGADLDHTQQRMLGELCATVKRWDTVAEQVPHIVARLQALQDLHAFAGNNISRVHSLSTRQERLISELSDVRATLKQLSTTMSDNAGVMARNLTVLGERLGKLEEQ